MNYSMTVALPKCLPLHESYNPGAARKAAILELPADISVGQSPLQTALAVESVLPPGVLTICTILGKSLVNW